MPDSHNINCHQAEIGHDQPVGVTFQFLLVGRSVIESSGRYSASKLMTSLSQPGHELPVKPQLATVATD